MTDLASGHRTGGPSDEWVYHLDVIQQPQRARACGFGDKDRRPLSPPPIIRLWVTTRTGEQVDISLVNIHFLVLMVDLWSADGQQQRSIVMHPSAQIARPPSPPPAAPHSYDPHLPYGPAPSSRPGSSESKPTAFASTHPTFSGARPPHLPIPSPQSSWSTVPTPRPQTSRAQSYVGRPPSLLVAEATRPFTAPSPSPHSKPLALSPDRQAFTLPPLHTITETFGRPGGSPSRLTLPSMQAGPSRGSTSSSSHEPRGSWSTEPSRSSSDFGFTRPGTSSTWQTSGSSAYEYNDHRKDPRVTGVAYPPSSPGFREDVVTPTFPGHSYIPDPYYNQQEVPRLQPTPPESSYSRVLVGSLCTVCQKLQDEHGRAGLFFFAHDLGVRTEGTFRLKFSLANLSSLMPGPAYPGQSTPVLAEIYSEAFTVFSAKRFPGVIPTTELTRVFARQNVRLPTRQRRARDDSPVGGEGEAMSGDEDD
ncbi:hypothetical protein EHS25_004383 [Saitozyma podzolica]|uniref:Velvet domain-containing protein n=1 Tax=Saitozyma podzolica TaxID=1890683 RepID=A0A427YU43_9TREE|nr:hypothetical protein EHS25_004383 [Saitozyma podzolica]